MASNAQKSTAQASSYTKKIRSAYPIYGAALQWLLYSLLGALFGWKLHAFGHLLVQALLAAGVYVLLTRRYPGRTVEIQRPVDTGDAELNRQLEAGRAMLERLRAANDAIPSATISAQLDRMAQAGEDIIRAVSGQLKKAREVRRFFQYYLPTTDKLLTLYQSLAGIQAPGENITRSVQSIENSLEMIATAFEKQLDNLYKDEALDISSDITVLETMIASEGLNDETITNRIKEEQLHV